MSKVKQILIAVVSVLLIIAVIGGVVGIVGAVKKSKAECPEHVFVDGVCENCGKAEKDVSYQLDVVTVNCEIKFFIDKEKKEQSFGMGTNGYSITGVYDNQTVFVTSGFSEDTQVKVYKCTYSKKGEFTGVYVDEQTTLFPEQKYDKELVYTMSIFTPTYEIQSDTDCLYIFEKV